MQNRIKELRQSKKITAQALADAIGTSRSMIEALQKGDRPLTDRWMKKIGDALGVSPKDLIADESAMVPVVGTVGAGAKVFPIDDYPLIRPRVMEKAGSKFRHFEDVPAPPDDCLEYVEAPPGVNPNNTVALRVSGDSMIPAMYDGWIIYMEQRVAGGCDEHIGKMCVVKVQDGPTYVKILKQGRGLGKYDLISHNASIIENVALEWCAKVIFIKPA